MVAVNKVLPTRMKFILFTLLMSLITCACEGGTHPSDASLIRNFNEHETDFNRLVNMAETDSHVVRIADGFTWLDTNVSWPRSESELGFSKSRWAEYRSIFKKLGIKDGINRREDIPGTIFFIVSSNGAALHGTSKGYAYTTKEPSPLAESLDGLNRQLKPMVPVYKRLQSNWYLYFEID